MLNTKRNLHFQSIILVGPMGAGKTTIGKLLAQHLDFKFIDTDVFIENQTGADISWIFEKEGELGFRNRETRAITELVKYECTVLATGGGVVMRDINRQILQQGGLVIYLNADVDTQYERTKMDRSRPLLKNDNPKQVLSNLYEIRDPLYREVADIEVQSGYFYPKKMVEYVLKEIESINSNYYVKVNYDH